MAKHEFGIMQSPPIKGVRYDEYEPEKYNCISVDDDFIEGILEALDEIDFYWHTLDVKGKGIAYCGITLIPPESLEAFIGVIKDIPELKQLSETALKQSKWIIHYGL